MSDDDFESLVETAARHTFAAAIHAPTPGERGALIAAAEYITEVRFSRYPTDWTVVEAGDRGDP